MGRHRKSKVVAVHVDRLKPTQFTVGESDVRQRIADIESARKEGGSKGLKREIASKTVPVVLGRHGRFYLIDRHHFCRGLWESDVPSRYKVVNCKVIDDLSRCPDAQAFWKTMAKKGYAYSMRDGRLMDARSTPRHISGLSDDPYRTLARALRGSGGGWKKNSTPFAELMWADFLRDQGVVLVLQAGDHGGGRRRDGGEAHRRHRRSGSDGDVAAMKGRRGDGKARLCVDMARSAQDYRPLPRRLVSLCRSGAAKGLPGWIPHSCRSSHR